MNIPRRAEAGSTAKNDIHIIVEPPAVQSADGIDLELQSPCLRQFGRQIEEVIRETLARMGISRARITAADGGALDYTIRARVETAVRRALGGR